MIALCHATEWKSEIIYKIMPDELWVTLIDGSIVLQFDGSLRIR